MFANGGVCFRKNLIRLSRDQVGTLVVSGDAIMTIKRKKVKLHHAPMIKTKSSAACTTKLLYPLGFTFTQQ